MMAGGCAHDFEIQYTRKHPGKIAECPYCDAKFMDGEQMVVREFAGKLIGHTKAKTVELFKEESRVDNKKVVAAVATVQALSQEEYELVLALVRREVVREKKVRGPRKKKGLAEAIAEAAPKA